MKFVVAAIVLALACGCSRPSAVDQERLGECFAEAAYAAVRAKNQKPKPTECCGECGKNGLPPGKVRSGDGLAVVSCPCPDTCKCKHADHRRTR